MRFRLSDLAANDVLAGAATGRRVLGLLLEQIAGDAKTPAPMYLDFQRVEIATASFLRESILEFREVVRRRWTNYYPVVANASDSVTEELSILLAQKDVFMLCVLDEAGRPGSPRLLGDLEPKQRLTFDLVGRLGEADARELMRSSEGSDGVGQTAWNNRLAALARLGLLMEITNGRAKRYRPLPLGS